MNDNVWGNQGVGLHTAIVIANENQRQMDYTGGRLDRIYCTKYH